jgi:hypothetical protein
MKHNLVLPKSLDLPSLENNSSSEINSSTEDPVEQLISSFSYGKDSASFFKNIDTITKQIDVNEIVEDLSCSDIQWSREWTDEDAAKFAAQFINDPDLGLDETHLDYNKYTPEYFQALYPRFDEDVYQILADYSNKKLEDNRNNLLRIKFGEFNPFSEE